MLDSSNRTLSNVAYVQPIRAHKYLRCIIKRVFCLSLCHLGYDPRTGLDMLIVQPVSKAQARQRCGRAGRECPGVCYRLYTEDSFKNLVETSTPEIQRSNLSGVILQLLALEIADVLSFDFMDAPSLDAMNDALSQLELLGAIESRDNPKVGILNLTD